MSGGAGRMASFGKVPFVFGACRAVALPGPVLVRLLGDLGHSEAGAKGVLHRMVGYGLLDLERPGRVGVYRLAGQLRTSYESFRDSTDAPAWDGRFHTLIYDIPETRRALRESFLAASARFGYRQLRPGVLVALRDTSAGLGELLTIAGVVPGWFAAERNAAAEVISRAWDLDSLTARYRAAIGRLDEARGSDASGAAAFRLVQESSSEAYLLLSEEGTLPWAALPTDWPSAELAAALARTMESLGPAVAEHAESVIAASRYSDLVEADPGWA